jgi:hypothetical protein
MAQVVARPWQATIRAQLTRGVGVDQIEEIDTDAEGTFTRRLRVVNGPGPGTIAVLDGAQLRELLGELRAEVHAPPAGVDIAGVEAFADLIEDALRCGPPSHLFDGARFGAVTHDESRGILYGHVGLGVDVIGTVRDHAHRLSFEQRLATGPTGVYRPLSPADCASLDAALKADPPADPGWQQIGTDAAAIVAGCADQ